MKRDRLTGFVVGMYNRVVVLLTNGIKGLIILPNISVFLWLINFEYLIIIK